MPGVEVTLLTTDAPSPPADPAIDGADGVEEPGIRRVRLPESPVRITSITPHIGVSYRVYLWLREHDGFDVIHFSERGGTGYLSP